MKIDQIKKEFPIFDEKIQNNDLVYLDSANSSQKPKIVIDRINEFYTKQFSNVGRSVHYLAVAATICMKIQDHQFRNILMQRIK
jgi:cysteine desulfurase/selenocysteine lyase